MPRYQRLVDGQQQEITGPFSVTRHVDGHEETVNFPFEWLASASDGERESFGISEVLTPVPVGETQALLTAQIDRDRDVRIDGGFSFMGNEFQSAPSDRENIMGMAQAAGAAIAGGAQPGNLRWLPDAQQDFGWITAGNDIVPMDAQGVVALFQRGLAFKAGLTFYGRALKDAVLAAATTAEAQAIYEAADWPT